MKKNIVIIDAGSSGSYFANDIADRGYYPVIFTPYLPSCAEESIDCVMRNRINITHECDFIDDQRSYEKNLEIIKKYKPIAVIPGRDAGVVLANKLCRDLGLRGNPVECSDAMTKKSAMHDALKKAGMRYIKGEIVSSSQEAEDFLSKNNLNCAVVKPVDGASSQGVVVANNINEVKAAVENALGKTDFWGKVNRSVLVQERIFGTEYIVNTMSRDGMHRVNSILVYKKVRTDKGAYVYSTIESVSSLKPGMTDLIKYALKTVEAIGIKNGPCHGEFMIDENGPILIEVNCRSMGLAMKKEFLDSIFGNHETDAILDCYLDEKKFFSDLSRPYRPKAKGCIKVIVVPKDTNAKSLPIVPILNRLDTTTEIRVNSIEKKPFYKKTNDLDSNGGVIFMLDKDPDKVTNELYYLCYLENYFFDFIISDKNFNIKIDDSLVMTNKSIYETANCCGSCLIVADDSENMDNVSFVKPENVFKIDDQFDNVILNFTNCLKKYSDQEVVDLIINIFSRVKPYGRAIVAPQTYKSVRYENKGIEVLMNLCDMVIELPQIDDHNIIVGTKTYEKFDNVAGWHCSMLP